MEINHNDQSGTHTYTLFLILRIIQTPRQIEIHHVHQSGTHTNTLSLMLKSVLKRVYVCVCIPD